MSMDTDSYWNENAFKTGWLHLCVSEKAEVNPDQPLEWQPRFCAILSEQRRFVACEDNNPREVFYGNEEIDSPCFDRRNVPYLYRKRRSSAPSVPLKDDGQPVLGSSGSTSGSGLKNFLARRLAIPLIRTRSTSKLGGKDKSENLKTRLVAWRSHESLFSECEEGNRVESIDIPLRGMTVVRPVHGSVLARQHCFQVTTPLETRYFTCSSAEDANNWIAGLKEILYPNRNKQSRLDTSLDLWIFEAKGVAQKRRYYCEVVLDKVLYARTSTKFKGDLLFWGEQFSFDDLPSVSVLGIHIFKENEGKKKRKEKSSFVGFMEIPIDAVQANAELEKWFPLTIPGSSPKPVPKLGGTAKADQSCLRVKLKYKTVSILPLSTYKDLHEYIRHNYLLICGELEPAISIKAKDELAQTILKILQVTNQAKQFLADIIEAEVHNQENENLIFRGNTLATKSMDTYMKMVGKRYLQETLGHFINTIYDQEGDCEVDPTKLTNGSNLAENQKLLLKLVEEAWGHILSSYCIFPSDLQEAFYLIRKKCQSQNTDVVMKLISGSVFLRFLCPAILSPSLFHLTQEYPDDKTARRLTLIAKTIQNLANFTRFGAKEEYMSSLNNFVEREMPSMKHFLESVSVEPTSDNRDNFDSFVDLGRELALLFELLQDHTKKLKEDSLSRLYPLMEIIASIKERQEHENTRGSERRKRSWTDGRINDHCVVVETNTVALYEDSVLSCADDYVSGCSLISHTPVKPRGSFERRTKGRANDLKLARAPGSVPSNMSQYGVEGQPELRRFLSGTGGVCHGPQPITRSSSYNGRASKKESSSNHRGLIRSTRLLLPQSVAAASQIPDSHKPTYGRFSLYMDGKPQPFNRGSRLRSSSEGGNIAKRGSFSLKLRNVKSEEKETLTQPTISGSIKEPANPTLVRSKVVKSQNRKSFLLDRKSFVTDRSNSVSDESKLTPGFEKEGFPPFISGASDQDKPSSDRTEPGRHDSESTLDEDSDFEKGRSHSPALARRNEFRRARKQKALLSQAGSNPPESTKEDRIVSGDPNLERLYSVESNASYAEDANSSYAEDSLSIDFRLRSDSDASTDITDNKLRLSEPIIKSFPEEVVVTDDRSTVDAIEVAKLPEEEPVSRGKHSGSFVSSCSSGCMDHELISGVSSNSCSCSSADETEVASTHYIRCRRQSRNREEPLSTARKSDSMRSTGSMDKGQIPIGPQAAARSTESKEDCENEVKLLRMELAKAQSGMEVMKESYTQQISKCKTVIDALKTKVNDTETKLQRQRREKEEQMKSIISRLMNVESELRKEQNEMQEILHAKQRIIDVQERRIKSLDSANRRLMTALSQLRNKTSEVNGTGGEHRLETYDARQDDGREAECV